MPQLCWIRTIPEGLQTLISRDEVQWPDPPSCHPLTHKYSPLPSPPPLSLSLYPIDPLSLHTARHRFWNQSNISHINCPSHPIHPLTHRHNLLPHTHFNPPSLPLGDDAEDIHFVDSGIPTPYLQYAMEGPAGGGASVVPEGDEWLSNIVTYPPSFHPPSNVTH